MLSNEIVLRPRFRITLAVDPGQVKAAFDKPPEPPLVVKQLDEHVFIRFDKAHTNAWTPQLHLELSSFDPGKTMVHGVFGPNPTLWTFFMFLHFGVATAFVILAVFAYSKHVVGDSIALYLGGMVMLVLAWFAFYAFGRLGRENGKPQMEELKTFLRSRIADMPRVQD